MPSAVEQIEQHFARWRVDEAWRVMQDADGAAQSERDYIAWNNQPDATTRRAAHVAETLRNDQRKKNGSRFGDAFPLDADGEALRDWSRHRANIAANIIARAPSFLEALPDLRNYAALFGVPAPQVRATATRATDPDSAASAVRRLRCSRWWKRTARTSKLRAREAKAIAAGKVHKRAAFAVSNEAIAWRREAQQRNADLLAGLEAVRERDGVRLELSSVIAGSLANPRVRKAEIGLRSRALEETAKRRGWIGFAVHLTCPSRFHARIEKTGKRNPKYDGSTPRDGQIYLRELWQIIRAKLTRKTKRNPEPVEFFGLRSAEPHHDGTPHWHMLIFCAPEHAERAHAIIRAEALRDTPDEFGAQQHRARIVPIDESKGSATGYILKYILKGIPGGVHGDAHAPDETGQLALCDFDAASHAERIVTWAWLHGIRQFQTFGRPARMAEWRELRRVREPVQLDLIEPARAFADAGSLADFIAYTERHPLSIIREPAGVRGFSGLTAYGCRTPDRLIGVACADQSTVTRLDLWKIERKGATGAGMESAAPWTRVNNCNAPVPPDPFPDYPPDPEAESRPDWWGEWFPQGANEVEK